MPPPPPPAYTTGGKAEETPATDGPAPNNGQSNDGAGKAPRQRGKSQIVDPELESNLNGERKIGRQLMMLLALLLWIVIILFRSFTYTVEYYTSYLDDTTITDDTQEDYVEAILSSDQTYLSCYIFLLIAILSHMYYFIHLGGQGGSTTGGPLTVFGDQLNCRQQTVTMLYWGIVILYSLGILLYYIGFIIQYNHTWSEDFEGYNSYYDEDDVSDDLKIEYEGDKIYSWAVMWPMPLYMVILCLQHAFPQFSLNYIECRICLWSFVLFSTLLIYAIYFSNDEFYKYNYDFYDEDSDEYERNESYYLGTRFMIWIVLIISLIIFGYSLMTGINIIQGTSTSQASKPDVFKIWVILGLLLFICMLVLTIFSAWSGFDTEIIWIAVIAICTDILL